MSLRAVQGFVRLQTAQLGLGLAFLKHLCGSNATHMKQQVLGAAFLFLSSVNLLMRILGYLLLRLAWSLVC